MDRDDVVRWLHDYIEAWKAYDREAIGALFAAEARYRYHPYDEWINGREEIVESWFDEPDEPGTTPPSTSPSRSRATSRSRRGRAPTTRPTAPRCARSTTTAS